MTKIAMAVHGGASSDTLFLRKNSDASKQGLADALQIGYTIIKQGGSALCAVENSIKCLEDNPLFNAGRGSALNNWGEVEMDASIMNGKNLKAGSVSMVRNIKNPIALAQIVMSKTKHVLLSGYGALELAKAYHVCLREASYFITAHQYHEFKKYQQRETRHHQLMKKSHGTVGAVALDKRGNLAAGTSTGGTNNCLPGRIGDSCIIGAGCYANNKTCAVSGTGEGEYLITRVVAYTISMMRENKMTLQAACDYVLHQRDKALKGRVGVISVDATGEIAIAYNTTIMKRAWVSSDIPMQVKIYN